MVSLKKVSLKEKEFYIFNKLKIHAVKLISSMAAFNKDCLMVQWMFKQSLKIWITIIFRCKYKIDYIIFLIEINQNAQSKNLFKYIKKESL